ncbi:hypothetical protein Leryth_013731 [Lithospermum erythrorhizon]|nr:hypothetical protein Leryth_013731 [Lithospermum erythrorhizon]
MDQPKFVIEAQEAQAMAQSLNLPSLLHLLPLLVHPAQSLASPPISNFHVAAVGLGGDGRIFTGVNAEFKSLPLHNSIHAEQFLITNLKLHNCKSLIAFAVSAAPCGHCRQFLQELRNSQTLKICITEGENGENCEGFKKLVELLSSPFGPFDLLDEKSPLLLEENDNGLVLIQPNLDKSGFLVNGFVKKDPKRLEFSLNSEDSMKKEGKRLDFCLNSEDSMNKEGKRLDFYSNSENLSNGYHENFNKNENLLIDEALKAANKSYAPYSGCPSGVALMDCDGIVYRGSYAESAAYNPSLGPVQAALVAFMVGGGGGYERIVAAVLVEKEGALVVQEDTAKIILKKVAPKCDLKVVYCFHGENGRSLN